MLMPRLQGKHFLYELYFKGKRTLDIGCGEGEFIRNDPMLIEGVEPNAEVVARLAIKGYRVAKGSLPQLPFADGSFEAVHSRNVIEHLDIPTAYSLLTESARMLTSGGILILASEVVTPRFWNTFGHTKPYPPGAIRKLLREESREEFDVIRDLEEVGTLYIGEYHRNRFLYLVSCLIAFYTPWLRREYVMMLRKKA